MQLSKRYTNFIGGRYFSEGLRMTAGIALPALMLGYFGKLPIGIAMSVGALCVSTTDSAGPVHHRANGMFLSIILVCLVSAATYVALSSELLTVSLILFCGFAFSMLSVYNARVSSLGISALLIMILSMETSLHGVDIFIRVGYYAIGGLWYMLFSLALNTLRPYRLIRQVEGDYIIAVADYLRRRADFYEGHPDYDRIYRELLRQQVDIQTQQNLLSELLFKTRAVTRNSTRLGRALLKIYIDVSELFESIMSAYRQYELLHRQFDETGILKMFNQQLISLAHELHAIGEAIMLGRASEMQSENRISLERINEKFQLLRRDMMKAANMDDFIALGRIMNNIQSLDEKITALHFYTKPQNLRADKSIPTAATSRATGSEIDARLFISSLNFRSNVFRHALRVACALAAGFFVSRFLHLGHSYWILLTIVVILKPAYSLTKTRNAARLAGTVAGIPVGVGILYLLSNQHLLAAIMFILMAIAYMFVRTKYLVSVFFMTIYLIIFFHLLEPGQIRGVLQDRLIDTGIGSGIAFLFSLFFIPAWEHQSIKKYMADLLQKEALYFELLAAGFLPGETPPANELRRNAAAALTALANVSDAFNRMLSEPKRHQKNTEQLYRFVVLNHLLNSHFSALSFYIPEFGAERADIFSPVMRQTINTLKNAAGMLEGNAAAAYEEQGPVVRELYLHTAVLENDRRAEIAAGNLETETKNRLIAKRAVVDQFVYIHNLSLDILKNVISFVSQAPLSREANADQQAGETNYDQDNQ